MDEIYVTYVDDEHVDNHDYDDNTDDDHDNNHDISMQLSNTSMKAIKDALERSRLVGDISMIYRWYIDDLSMI